MLESVQYRACKLITGAFRCTSKPALDVEAYLPPVKYSLMQAIGDSLLRIRSTALFNRILDIRNGHNRRQQAPTPHKYQSPLMRAEQYFISEVYGTDVEKVERMSPYICEPWWEPIPVHLGTLDEAINRHDQIVLDGEHIRIYTDGSGIEGGVGAAAVIPALGRTKRAYLGSEQEFTVYSAELYGICMALWMCLDLHTSSKKIAIFTDNQAAIQASHEPRISSGQYLTHLIIALTRELRAQGFVIDIHWIPAHVGVAGNEMADKAAKEATGHEGYPRADSPSGLMVLKSSLRQRLRSVTKERWKADWAGEKRGRALFRLIEAPTAKVLHLHNGLPKSISSAIVQMRTGKSH